MYKIKSKFLGYWKGRIKMIRKNKGQPATIETIASNCGLDPFFIRLKII